MQIVLHAGVHATDDDRLIKCLLKSRDPLHDAGIAVPGPSRYRRELREALRQLSLQAPEPGAREAFLDQTLDLEAPDRVVLSNENFFCVPKLALHQATLYAHAETKLADLREFFAGDDLELFFAIRNPATFLPDVFALSPQESFDQFLFGADPLALRWSDMIQRIRETLPEVKLTLWCHEDAPLVWGEVLRRMAGLPEDRVMEGEFDLLSDIMAPEGMARLQEFLAAHPGMTESQRRRAAAAILDKFAIEEALEEELSGTDWDELMIDMITELYEEDVYQIGRMPGVTLLLP